MALPLQVKTTLPSSLHTASRIIGYGGGRVCRRPENNSETVTVWFKVETRGMGLDDYWRARTGHGRGRGRPRTAGPGVRLRPAATVRPRRVHVCMNLSPRRSITHSCALWLLLILTRCSWSRGVARAGAGPADTAHARAVAAATVHQAGTLRLQLQLQLLRGGCVLRPVQLCSGAAEPPPQPPRPLQRMQMQDAGIGSRMQGLADADAGRSISGAEFVLETGCLRQR
jgi:hypothetical protein